MTAECEIVDHRLRMATGQGSGHHDIDNECEDANSSGAGEYGAVVVTAVVIIPHPSMAAGGPRGADHGRR